jgi:hypothetical protein
MTDVIFVAGAAYIVHSCVRSLACAYPCKFNELKKKKKLIGLNHNQEGIGHGCQPAGQVEGEQ